MVKYTNAIDHFSHFYPFSGIQHFTESYDHHHDPFSELFIVPNWTSVPICKRHLSIALTRPLATTTLQSVSANLTTLKSSYEWNHAVCVCVCAWVCVCVWRGLGRRGRQGDLCHVSTIKPTNLILFNSAHFWYSILILCRYGDVQNYI